MLGYVLTSQPTVILSEFQRECLDMCLSDNGPWSWDEKVNARICAPPTSDHDPANAFFTENCNNCNVCNFCNFDAELLFSIYKKSVMSVIWCRPIVFDFISY